MINWVRESIIYELFLLGFCGVLDPDKKYTSENRIKKLEQFIIHLKELNVNAVYLGPIFESTYHGYDTINYFKVDQRLGTNDNFKEICKLLHENGIKIILDGVFNHVGRDFFAFKDVQKNRENSKYCSWFVNLNFNGNTCMNDGFYYDSWSGCYDLVKLNVRNPEVSSYLLKAVGYWIEDFDIDGLRIDAADTIDFEFLKQLRSFTDSKKKDFWLMGEVVHGDYSRWANNEMLHSVTNYECYKGLYSSHNDKNYFEIAHSLNRQFGKGGIYENLCLYNFVDNHDVNRLASMLKEPENIYNVYTLLYTMPGVPSIYYGSEYGIQGEKGVGTDAPLRPELDIDNLENPNKKLYKYLCKLGKIRKQSQALMYGNYEAVLIKNEQFVFSREINGEKVYIALNLSKEDSYLSFKVCFERGANLLSADEKIINWENANIIVPPHSAKIIKSI